MTRSTQLRNSMSEVVKAAIVRTTEGVRQEVELSCGHRLVLREREKRSERRCPMCAKKVRHG